MRKLFFVQVTVNFGDRPSGRRLRNDDGYVSKWFGGLDVCLKGAVQLFQVKVETTFLGNQKIYSKISHHHVHGSSIIAQCQTAFVFL